MSVKTFRVFVMNLLTFTCASVIISACPSENTCEAPVAGIDSLAVNEGDMLPDWSIGTFSRYRTDQWESYISNLEIDSSGDVHMSIYGPDYYDCRTGNAQSDGAEVIIMWHEPGSKLVRDKNGRLYFGRIDAKYNDCDAWIELKRGSLCGPTGGCGGSNEAEPCSWEQATRSCTSSFSRILDGGIIEGGFDSSPSGDGDGSMSADGG